MAAPHKFLRKLHDVIGEEGTNAMAEWMNRTDEKLDELHADIAELRHEVESRASQRHAEILVRLAHLDRDFAQRQADLTKWMLGFWVLSLVTYVGTLLGLAQFVQ